MPILLGHIIYKTVNVIVHSLVNVSDSMPEEHFWSQNEEMHQFVSDAINRW